MRFNFYHTKISIIEFRIYDTYRYHYCVKLKKPINIVFEKNRIKNGDEYYFHSDDLQLLLNEDNITPESLSNFSQYENHCIIYSVILQKDLVKL